MKLSNSFLSATVRGGEARRDVAERRRAAGDGVARSTRRGGRAARPRRRHRRRQRQERHASRHARAQTRCQGKS